jgi:flagellar hook-associated protein 1
MTDLISIGASGVKAYTAALATVGDNIANSQTPGFVRRAIQTSEVSAGGDVVLFRNQIRPGGVLATGVSRAVDAWLVEDARVAGGEAGRTSARLNWLESSERALDDTTSGVGANMTSMFNSADRLSTNPADTRLRSAFLQSAADTAAAFRRSANGLERSSVGIQTDAQATVTQLNSDIAALEHVNAGLRRARDASTNQASLMDERDRLLDSISSAIGISAEFDGRGAATVRLASPSNEPLVASGTVSPVTVTVQTNGLLSYGAASGNSFTPASGKLAGLADAATDVAGRRSSLDSLAIQFATDFNTQAALCLT